MLLQELEAKRAARKAALEEQRAAQYAIDLEALDALECEHGDGMVSSVEVPAFSPGLPTMSIVRAPKGVEYKRFRDRIANAKGAGAAIVQAQDELASACRVYPEPEVYKALCEKFAGLHVSASVAAVKLADARAADEGKG